MKKHMILVLAFSTLSMFGCEEEFEMPSSKPEGSTAHINFIRPLSASVGEEVTITGEHFDQSFQKHEVTFNDHYAEIIHADGNTIKVKVPENLLPGEYSINLFTNGQHVISEEKINVTDSRF